MCIICLFVLLTHGGGTRHYLTLVRDAGVETVMKAIALEVDLVGHPIVERIVSEVITV